MNALSKTQHWQFTVQTSVSNNIVRQYLNVLFDSYSMVNFILMNIILRSYGLTVRRSKHKYNAAPAIGIH